MTAGKRQRNKRRRQRIRSCGDKIRNPSLRDAQEQIDRVIARQTYQPKKRYGHVLTLNAYRCAHCSAYHVGHR